MKNSKRYLAVVKKHLMLLVGKIRFLVYKHVFGLNNFSKTHEQNVLYNRPMSFTSQLCTSSHFDMPFFNFWINRLKENVRYHRKQWEFVYVCQTLYEHGLLQEGKQGLVFGCGKEPLISLFASLGCKITATDLDVNNDDAVVWTNTNQHIKENFLELNSRKICENNKFLQNVSFKNIDMNNIPCNLTDYDFCWSCSSLEHLGSIQKGLDFIKNSLNILKKGGLAIHITEFNLSSNNKTFESSQLSIFREKDIRNLISDLESEGHKVYPLILEKGNNLVDKYVDFFPYQNSSVHLKLKINKYDVTSIGLIIEK